MRMIICGDTHIGAIFGLGRPNGKGSNTRVDDYENTFNSIVDHAINTKADIFIQTGDIFESRNPSVEHMKVVDKALRRLSNENIATFVIMGNHDYKKSGPSFTSSITSLASADYPNVRMLIEPEIIQVCNSSNEKVNILLLPYRDRKMYKGKSVKEQSDGYNNEIINLVSSAASDIPLVAVGHNFFYEGSYNDYGGTEILTSPQAFKGADLVVMGHLHQFRVLRKRAPVCVYSGSMEKTNFGDSSVDKYYIDYNILNKKIKFCKTKTRELVDDSFDLTGVGFADVQNRIEEELEASSLEDKIVRLKLVVDEKVLPVLDVSRVETAIYSHGAFYVSKVIIEPIAQRIVRDNAILGYEDDYEMFEAFLKSQNIDLDSKELLLTEAKEIMGKI